MDIKNNNGRINLHPQQLQIRPDQLICNTPKPRKKAVYLNQYLNNILYQDKFSHGQRMHRQMAEVNETTIRAANINISILSCRECWAFRCLSSGVFGTAFVFLSLRLTLVIKRFFATPVKKYSIVLGEAMARLVFS